MGFPTANQTYAEEKDVFVWNIFTSVDILVKLTVHATVHLISFSKYRRATVKEIHRLASTGRYRSIQSHRGKRLIKKERTDLFSR